MPKIELSLENLHEVDDGTLREEYAMKLKEIIRDCYERQAVNKARTITLELAIVPSTSAGFKVDTRFKITTKKPPSKSRITEMNLDHGKISFNPVSPDNADQLTLDEIEKSENFPDED